MSGIDLIAQLQRGGPDAPHPDAILKERSQRTGRFSRSHAQLAPTYVATEALCLAVDVALSLGRPLLLTGEPGSGKTLAASWIAYRLGLLADHFVQFHVHSDSRARDLRYEFDAVGWFRASQLANEPVPKKGFITPRALGTAFGWREDRDTGRPYVVLIDEIDKAPRDFPNDLLLELDQMRFVIDETQEHVGPPAERPIIVVTSNAERRLPDPFLRRCVVHHIELDDEAVGKILTQSLGAANQGGTDGELVKAAAALWTRIKKTPLARSPTIAEYWQWLALASRHGGLSAADLGQAAAKVKTLPFIPTLMSAADLETFAAGGA